MLDLVPGDPIIKAYLASDFATFATAGRELARFTSAANRLSVRWDKSSA